MARITKEMRKIIRDELEYALDEAKRSEYEYYTLCQQDVFNMDPDEFEKYMDKLTRSGNESSRLMNRLYDMIDAYKKIGYYCVIDHYSHGHNPRYQYENAEIMEI